MKCYGNGSGDSMVPSVEEAQHIIAGWYSSSGPFAGTFEIELPPLATYRNSANGRRWSMRCELTRGTVCRKDSHCAVVYYIVWVTSAHSRLPPTQVITLVISHLEPHRCRYRTSPDSGAEYFVMFELQASPTRGGMRWDVRRVSEAEASDVTVAAGSVAAVSSDDAAAPDAGEVVDEGGGAVPGAASASACDNTECNAAGSDTRD